MAVITRYVVERNGVEKMTFTSKAEADAYDKMLDMADALQIVLQDSTLLATEQEAEALALYLAQQKDALLVALGAKKAPAKVADKADDNVADKTSESTVVKAVASREKKAEHAA